MWILHMYINYTPLLVEFITLFFFFLHFFYVNQINKTITGIWRVKKGAPKEILFERWLQVVWLFSPIVIVGLLVLRALTWLLKVKLLKKKWNETTSVTWLIQKIDVIILWIYENYSLPKVVIRANGSARVLI